MPVMVPWSLPPQPKLPISKGGEGGDFPERPTENEVAQFIREIARETTSESTREIVEPIVGEIAGKIDSIGQHVQNLDRVGHSAEKSFANLSQIVQGLHQRVDGLVHDLQVQFAQTQAQLDAANAQNAKAHGDSQIRGNSLALHVGDMEAALDKKFQHIEAAMREMRLAPPHSDTPVVPQGMQVVPEGQISALVTDCSQMGNRLKKMEEKIGEMIAGQIPNPVHAQEIHDVAQNLQKWQQWATKSVGDLEREVGALKIPVRDMQKKAEVAPPSLDPILAEMGQFRTRLDTFEQKAAEHLKETLKNGESRMQNLENRVTEMSNQDNGAIHEENKKSFMQFDARLQLIENWIHTEVEKKKTLQAELLAMAQQNSELKSQVTIEVGKLQGRLQVLEKERSEIQGQVGGLAAHFRASGEKRVLDVPSPLVPAGTENKMGTSRTTAPPATTTPPTTTVPPGSVPPLPPVACPDPSLLPPPPLQALSRMRGQGTGFGEGMGGDSKEKRGGWWEVDAFGKVLLTEIHSNSQQCMPPLPPLSVILNSPPCIPPNREARDACVDQSTGARPMERASGSYWEMPTPQSGQDRSANAHCEHARPPPIVH
jgi:peptidoglycan hydrolase CwlO-like protein